MSVRKKLNKLVCNCIQKDAESATKIIDRFDVVSFDIFDTLAKRNVRKPEDIFVILGRKIKNELKMEISDFAQLRITAEKQARHNLQAGSEEVTLDEIYDSFRKVLSLENVEPDDSQIEKIKQMEIDTELEYTTPNCEIINLYNMAKQLNKTIIIVSDMYLDKAVIEKMLNKISVTDYSDLFLSSELQKTKRSGSLFDEVVAKYRGKSIIHIGDNLRSDYLAPKKKEICPFLINRDTTHLEYWKRNANKERIDYSEVYGFLNNNIPVQPELAYRIGYEVLGPMLLGFCQFLHKHFREDNIEKYLFLSRDGKIMKMVYEILFPEEKDKCIYFHASRKALINPLLSECKDYDDFFGTLLPVLHVTSFDAVCGVCELPAADMSEYLQKLGYSLQTDIFSIDEKDKAHIYEHIMLLGKKYFSEQKEALHQYTDSVGINGNTAVIDIGWNGTSQRLFQKSVSEDIKLFGYYLGVRNTGTPEFYKGVNRLGYFLNPGDKTDYELRTRFAASIMDILFIFEEGSTKGYFVTEDGVGILYSNIEYGTNEIKLVEQIHRGAMDVVNRFVSCFGHAKDGYLSSDEYMHTLMSVYSKAALNPSKKVLDYFADFVIDEGVKVRMVSDKKLGYYIIHPKKLITGLNHSLCKIWFLKSVFGIPIPYYSLLKMAAKLGVKSKYRKKMIKNSK